LQLLSWAKDGKIAHPASYTMQEKMVKPFIGILEDYGISVDFGNDVMKAKRNDSRQLTLSEKALTLMVYPAMLVKPKDSNAIFISDFEARYSGAYAVENIKTALNM